MKKILENSKVFLRTGIYVRVSTEEQAQEGFSIRAQTEKLKSYALLKDWEIYDIYNDEGISGKNIIDRPNINRLINDIKDGKVNNVLVFKVDRLTRSTKNLIELVELFDEYKCAFNSLNESIDTDTPSGRMFLKIIGIFAEFERENLVTRLKMGFERKVKEGYTLARNGASYGYNLKKGQRIQEILPEEAIILKDIFTMYVDENMSMCEITKILNKRKIKTKTNAKGWDTKTIKQILINPTYIGKVRYSTDNEAKYFEADGHHEPIILEKLFYLAQEKMKNAPNISRTKRPKEDNYFCGILICGICGSKYTTHHTFNKIDESGKKTYYKGYKCSKKISYNDEITCKSPTISHIKMEQAFCEYIKKINNFSEIENIEIENNSTKKENELLKYITDCENKLIDLQDRKKSIMEQYINREIIFEDYKTMITLLNEKYESQEEELQRVKSKIPNTTENSNILKEDIILNLKENWDYLNNNEKMIFLQRFIKKIVINIEKESKNLNIVNIKELEFNLSTELSL